MSLEIKGKITNILDVETGESKAGKSWSKQVFVVDTGAQYNPEVAMEVFGAEKIEQIIAPLSVGQEITASINISSREYNGRYFHNISTWKVTVNGSDAPAPKGLNDSDADQDEEPPF